MIETNYKLMGIVMVVCMTPSTIAIIILESGLLLAGIVFSCIFGSVALYGILDRKCPFNTGHDFHLKPDPNVDYLAMSKGRRISGFQVVCVKCGRERREYLPL